MDPIAKTGISSSRRWEHFDHMADLGVRGTGESREAAFEEAAHALTAAITDRALVRPAVLFEVECEAPNDDFLLVDWLNALISEMSARRMIFSRFEVRIADHYLHGRAGGERADPERHHPAVEIKGATMTELKVARDAAGTWTAQCVVDV